MIDDGAAAFGFGAVRREPIDVAESRRQDTSLPRLIHVHKRRTERKERECIEARDGWRTQRAAARAAKLEWRAARTAAQDFWADARAAFFRMVISSGKFRSAKSTYERKKREAEQMRLRACETAHDARRSGKAYFFAKAEVRAAHVRSEKFDILHQALQASNKPAWE
jgi:hypothetical protein